MRDVPLILFEDPGYRRFGPLTALRPVWDLVIGLETLANRIARRLDRQPSSWVPREDMKDLVKEQYGVRATHLPTKGDVYLVNGRVIGHVPREGLAPDCRHLVWTDGPDVIAARIPAKVARRWLKLPKQNPADFSAQMLVTIWGREMGTPEVEIREEKGSLAWWPWDLLRRQGEIIRNSLRRVGDGAINGDVHHSAILVEESRMHVAEGASVAAGAVINASDAPVIVMEGVRVMPGAVIIGPAVIGPHSTVKVGAKLYGPLTVGPVCKLGGEIEDSIFIGYSNKQHDGFLGHAIVGEWVNLGADTNNSDLKNNYSTVKVVIHGETIDTGETFFGSLIGDHVKTAINTQLNTGTVIGVGTNVFGAGFPPKTIGAFRWGGAGGFEIYDFEKFRATAELVMARRDRRLTPATLQLMKKLHQEAIGGGA